MDRLFMPGNDLLFDAFVLSVVKDVLVNELIFASIWPLAPAKSTERIEEILGWYG
jgi:hypothetical protein